MRLAGKVAVITGGGGPGIGGAVATRFAREGARVVVVDLEQERAAGVAERIVAEGGAAIGVHADISDAESVAALHARTLAEYGRADILVNNAGRSHGDDIRTIDEATWDRNFTVVLKTAFLCAKAFVPTMIEQGGGAIVNISSVNGMTGLGEEGYGAAKAGMINFTQNLAIKYGRYGVRANCICPGTIRTPAWERRKTRDPQVFERLTKWYPLGRIGEPDDIANAALFLASDEASWLTGAIIPVDGGLMAGNPQMNRELVGDI